MLVHPLVTTVPAPKMPSPIVRGPGRPRPGSAPEPRSPGIVAGLPRPLAKSHPHAIARAPGESVQGVYFYFSSRLRLLPILTLTYTKTYDYELQTQCPNSPVPLLGKQDEGSLHHIASQNKAQALA
jgi:hypothetical protein